MVVRRNVKRKPAAAKVSAALPAAVQEAGVRARPEGRMDRAEQFAQTRRRRRPGSLNRLYDRNLDFIPPEQLDPAYVYRWINDEKGRIRHLTRMDDYDFVTASEFGDGFDVSDITGTESTERIRKEVEVRNGQTIYAYLCKKPRIFWEQDNEEIVRAREDLMAGRVYRGTSADETQMAKAAIDATPDDRDANGEEGNFYVPGGVQVGSATMARKRGPVPHRFK